MESVKGGYSQEDGPQRRMTFNFANSSLSSKNSLRNVVVPMITAEMSCGKIWKVEGEDGDIKAWKGLLIPEWIVIYIFLFISCPTIQTRKVSIITNMKVAWKWIQFSMNAGNQIGNKLYVCIHIKNVGFMINCFFIWFYCVYWIINVLFKCRIEIY